MEGHVRTRTIGKLSFPEYIGELWRYRFLCFHLAYADLQSRFRRSSLGVLWVMIHSLAFAMLYSLVLATMFKQDFREYSIYVLSGVVLWDAISSSASAGSHSLINAAGYLRQSPIPSLIFPIRSTLTVMTIFLIGLVAYTIYTLGVHYAFGARFVFSPHWVWLLPISVALFLFGLALATITSYLNAKYRDTQQVIMIVTQAVWFASPVFMARELFDAPLLRVWTSINPVRAFCDVFRSAVMYARSPMFEDWVVIAAWVVIVWTLAIMTILTLGRKTIFSL